MACNTITRGAEDNVLNGTNGCDYIDVDGGHDVVYALAGNDEIHLGSGSDDGFRQDNSDVLYGGAGNEQMRGQAGPDTLSDVQGADSDKPICGDAGDDFINIEDGSVGWAYGGGGQDGRNIDAFDYWSQDGNC